MRPLHSPQHFVTLAVPLTAAVLALGACSSEDSSKASSTDSPADASTEASSEPLLGEVSEDGSCDPEIVDIDHESPSMTLIYNAAAGTPENELTTEVHFTDPDREPEFGGGLGHGGGGDDSRASLSTGTPNEEIDHIEVTATPVDGDPETC
ncbi:MAG TPA: hypothetical protein H9870_12940, partial [Candidatus Corynebacterium avicola]|nr:hypothetical protein [Candidatus Corynebacterium avicola]